MADRGEWVWMPHAAHFICARDCRFHLATWVGNYIVSTVGEYEPDSATREILARSRGVILEGRGDARRADYASKIGWEEIGSGRKYETFVFPAKPRPSTQEQCCLYMAASWTEIDSAGANEAGDAYRNHMALCEKWAAMPAHVVDA
jgi:hypothetical protein